MFVLLVTLMVCVIVIFVYKFYKHVNLNKRQPGDGYQLIKLLTSGKNGSIKQIEEHLYKIAPQINPKCNNAEIYAATEATIGAILSTSFMTWNNEMVYSDFSTRLDDAREFLLEKNVGIYETFVKDIVLLSIMTNGNEDVRNRFQYYARESLRIYQNPDPDDEKAEKFYHNVLFCNSIGNLMMYFINMAVKNRE